MIAPPPAYRGPKLLIGLLAAAVLLALVSASGCSSTGYTANNCGGKLDLYNVAIDGAVPPSRRKAAGDPYYCVTLPGHATSGDAGAD